MLMDLDMCEIEVKGTDYDIEVNIISQRVDDLSHDVRDINESTQVDTCEVEVKDLVIYEIEVTLIS